MTAQQLNNVGMMGHAVQQGSRQTLIADDLAKTGWRWKGKAK
jgi:hypothetical protein